MDKRKIKIIIEGSSGSGKTTIINKISDILKKEYDLITVDYFSSENAIKKTVNSHDITIIEKIFGGRKND